MNMLHAWFTKYFYVWLTVTVVVFAYLVTWNIAESPATWFDEGINMGIAKSLVKNGVYSLSVGPDSFVSERPFLITTNYPVLLPVAGALWLFDNSLLSARLPMVIFLFAFGLSAFFLAKRLYGEKAALGTLLLVMSFAPLYGNGRAVLGEVPGLLFFIGGLLASPRDMKLWRLVLAGLLFGLSVATKPFFLIVLPAVLLGEWYRHSFTTKVFWQRTSVIFGVALVPIVIWLRTILPDVSLSGLLTTGHYYSNSYADSNFMAQIVENLRRFITESTPIHLLFLVVVTGLGIIVARKRRQSLDVTEITVLAFCTMTILWYLKTPGWYRYFFAAHVMLFLFTPAYLMRIFPKYLAGLLIASLCMFQSVHLVTRHNDSLYNDGSATVFNETLAAHTKSTDTILIINSPSVAFLTDRPVEQYLQINPELHFGVIDWAKRYDFLVTTGSVSSVQVPNTETEMQNYTVIATVGHYQLHKRNEYVRN